MSFTHRFGKVTPDELDQTCEDCNKDVSICTCPVCSHLVQPAKYCEICNPKSFELNKIYNMDCLKGMKLLPNNYIDLTITSPPYDNLRDYKGYSFNFEEIAKEIYRITKQSGILIWVVNDATIDGNETGTSFKQALYFKSIGFKLHDTMIYKKRSFAFPSLNRYHQIFEYMFVFSKGEPKTIHLIKDKKNTTTGSWGNIASYQKDGTKLKGKKKIISPFGIRNNVWEYVVGSFAKHHYKNIDDDTGEHPAIFPLQLAKDHIITWSNENDLILDPFMGSGTTAKASKILNRKFIGFEISSEYCKIAENRLNQEVLNGF